MAKEDFEDVLLFWFPKHLVADHAAMANQFEWWFRGGADAATAERITGVLERAARGDLDHWSHGPRSRPALMVVLDQFSRSIHRGTARAFAQDRRRWFWRFKASRSATTWLSRPTGRRLSSSCLWGTPRSSRIWRRRSSLPSSSRRRRSQSCAEFLEHSAS
jgi:uncharacterized protein (DUF924 family)